MDEQTIFNLLECSVCLEPLDVTSRVLPCQHTFCMRCLQQLLTSRHELKCPECRDIAPCRAVTELPTNILLVRLLDGLKRPAKPPGSPPLGTSGGSGSSGSSVPGTSETAVSARASSAKSTIQSQPCAIALYKYDAQEHGDLSFNKSDLILLHKKIDDNWYQGVVVGSSEQIGFFPASYVQVLTPLPPDPPQCKALYDFEVNEQEEKDCLTFNKDEVLNVIRRVDENWVEGKKGDKIGIFPLSFVELNGTAKALVDAHAGIEVGSGPSHQSQGSGDAGSSPDQAGSSQEGGSKNKAKRHSFTSLLGLSVSAQSRSKETQPTVPVSTSTSSTNNASTSTSSANTSSNTNTATSSSNRHSMDISSPVLVRSSNPTAANLIDSKSTTQQQQQGVAGSAVASTSQAPVGTAAEATAAAAAVAATSSRKKPAPLTGISQVPATSTRGPNSPSVAASPTVTQAGNAEFRFVADAPASPKPKGEVYVAMYSYKATKTDELELKKGDFYSVTEKCKDGWFKGMAVKSRDQGFFPGNYMQACRPERSSRKPATTQASESRASQQVVAPTATSAGQGIRPRLPSDAASRASRTGSAENPASSAPTQGLRPRVKSDASSRMAAQRAAAAAAAATSGTADGTSSSPTVSLNSATTQTASTRTSVSRVSGQQQSQGTSASTSTVAADRRTVSQIPNGQKTVAQLQSERAAQQMQYRPPPPNFPSGRLVVGQTRHSDKSQRGSPPTVATQTSSGVATSRTNPGQGQTSPQPSLPQVKHAGATAAAPVSVRPRVTSGQAAVGSPPALNGPAHRMQSPNSPQPGAQEGVSAGEARPKGSPPVVVVAASQGSPRGVSATQPQSHQSTPPQVDLHLGSSSSKTKRHSAQIPATSCLGITEVPSSRQVTTKPRRHSESDNDTVRSRRVLSAKSSSHPQHPVQCNTHMHSVPASCSQQPSSKPTLSHSSSNGSSSCSSSTPAHGVSQSPTSSTSSPSPQPPSSGSRQPSVPSPHALHSKPCSPSVYRVPDHLPFAPPPNATAPDCLAPSLASLSKPDKKDKKERKSTKKRPQSSPEEAAPPPLARGSSLPDGQDTPAPEPCCPQRPSLPVLHGEGSGEEPAQGAEGTTEATASNERRDKPPKTTPLVRERYRVLVSYPTESEAELELKVGETVFVHSKREDGWYRGTQQRTGKTGLFPGNFVESY